MSPLCSRNALLVEGSGDLAQKDPRLAQKGSRPLPGRYPARSEGLIRAILGQVHEQAWKDHPWSLAAALFGKRRLGAAGWVVEYGWRPF